MTDIKAAKTSEKNMHLAKLVQVASNAELPVESVSARCIEVYISRHVFATICLDETEALLWKS